MRLSRPVYESLPYAYMLIGAVAIGVSFLWRAASWSDLLASLGVILIVAGLVLVLKRRDYRSQARRYGHDFDDD